MKLLEYSDKQAVTNIREWNSQFSDVVEAIKVIEAFLVDPQAHSDDEDYLRFVFNNVEILKSSIDLNRSQKELCSKVTEMVQEMSGYKF